MALNIAYSLCDEDRFEFILWFSARDIDLLPTGAKQVSPHVISIADLAKEYCALADTLQEFEESAEQRQFIEKSLSDIEDGSMLFIFDNFETVESTVDIYRWIDAHIRLPNKVLITTRNKEFKGDYAIKVEGMTEVEFYSLIDVTAMRLGVESLVDRKFKKELFSESGGHPYVGKILLGDVAQSRKVGKIERIVAGKDEILAALFERTYNKLSPAAQRCFLTLSGWRSLVPVVALESVLLLSADERLDVQDAVEELENHSFIEIEGDDASDVEFVRVPLVAMQFGQRKLGVSPLKFRIEADIKLLQRFGATQATDVRHGISRPIDRVFSYIAVQIGGQSDRLSLYYPMIEYLCRKYNPAWLFYVEILQEIGTSQAIEDAKRAVRAFLEEARGEERAKGWVMLIDLCKEAGDIEGEIHARLELCEMPGFVWHEMSRSANIVNSALARGELSIEGAEKRVVIERLADVMRNNVGEDATATDLSRLAWLFVHLQDLGQARHFAKAGLAKEVGNEYCLRLLDRIGFD